MALQFCFPREGIYALITRKVVKPGGMGLSCTSRLQELSQCPLTRRELFTCASTVSSSPRQRYRPSKRLVENAGKHHLGELPFQLQGNKSPRSRTLTPLRTEHLLRVWSAINGHLRTHPALALTRAIRSVTEAQKGLLLHLVVRYRHESQPPDQARMSPICKIVGALRSRDREHSRC